MRAGMYELRMPNTVYGGLNSLENLSSILTENHAKKVVILTDPGVRASGLLERPFALIQKSGAEFLVLDDLKAEPTVEQAESVIQRCRTHSPDFILGIGGGSVMDVAKLCSVLVGNEIPLRDLLDRPLIAKKSTRCLLIPTTAGTGSEATPNSIVTVVEKDLKVGIVNPDLVADFVILDAEMIRKLPGNIVASTGLDALTHAIECFTSKKANPFSDMFALQALRLILDNIESAYSDPDNMEAKSAMLTASFFGGVAITAAGTTAVHALSYPLGGKYHIPHGLSNAILLVPVMKFNEPACRERLARVYDAVNPQSPITEVQKSAWVIQRLSSIIQNLNIPTSLSTFGIGMEGLDELVDAGLQVKRLLVNNRRTVTAEDARNIYLQIM